jgi:hypothetical protein
MAAADSELHVATAWQEYAPYVPELQAERRKGKSSSQQQQFAVRHQWQQLAAPFCKMFSTTTLHEGLAPALVLFWCSSDACPIFCCAAGLCVV